MAVPLAADYGRAVDRDNGAAPSCDGAGMLSRLFARRRAEHVEVLVELSASACASPYLIARVSGPSVAIAVSPRNASLAAAARASRGAARAAGRGGRRRWRCPLARAPARRVRRPRPVRREPDVRRAQRALRVRVERLARRRPARLLAARASAGRPLRRARRAARQVRARDADALPGAGVPRVAHPVHELLPKRFVERHAQSARPRRATPRALDAHDRATYALRAGSRPSSPRARRSPRATRTTACVDRRLAHEEPEDGALGAESLFRIAFAQVNWPEQVAERARRFCRVARKDRQHRTVAAEQLAGEALHRRGV